MTLTDPIPPLRRDISIQLMQENGVNYLVLFDPNGYSSETITIFASVTPIIEMADGTASASEITEHINELAGEKIEEIVILSFFNMLDQYGFLESTSFIALQKVKNADFLNASVRPAVHAGTAYPSNPDELRKFIDGLMNSCDAEYIETHAFAAFIPHIDLRIGAESYAPAYHALSGSEPDVVVIFATSHYGWQDLFILTDKDFETPLGIVQTDKKLVADLRAELPFTLTSNDIAHQNEHSIEFQLLFLQNLFTQRPFTILPILVTSFHSFVESGMEPKANKKLHLFTEILRDVLAKSGKKAIFIASGDMAHIGRKFDDKFDAETILEMVRGEDSILLEKLTEADPVGFFGIIAENQDRRHICGLPPVYSMLETINATRGSVLDYRQWNERERGSAVTFASVSFFDGV